jgi:micrococcal nuclease
MVVALLFALLSLQAMAQPCDLGRSANGNTDSQRVKIKNVIDGDTVRLQDNRLVRFIGINTPEIDHETGQSEPFAEKAREFLQAVIDKQQGYIQLQYDSENEDRHGRQLAHVFALDGENIQASMIAEGMGVWITVPPNLQYLECYRQSEHKARQQRAGVWAAQFRIPKETTSLTKQDRGFQWMRGKVTRIGQGKKYLWLNFGENVAARVHKDDLHYFQDKTFATLKNKIVVIKGWLFPYKKQLVMGLRHPASMEIVE